MKKETKWVERSWKGFWGRFLEKRFDQLNQKHKSFWIGENKNRLRHLKFFAPKMFWWLFIAWISMFLIWQFTCDSKT